MLGSLTLILLCQLAGEIITRLGHLPVPGPVIGMVILFCILVIHGGIHHELETTGGTLLRNLSLLFVPAGVGVVTNLDILKKYWAPIAGAIIIGTMVTIALTGTLMQYLDRHRKKSGEGEGH